MIVPLVGPDPLPAAGSNDLAIEGACCIGPDTEGEQAVLKVVVIAAILCYYTSFVAPGNGWSQDEILIAAGVTGFFIIAVGILVSIWIRPRKMISRRIIGILSDNGFATFYVWLATENGVLMSFVYVFIAFGTGARYGGRYLMGGAVLGWIGFASALLFVPYWQMHRVEGLELLVALTILPIYVRAFLQQRDMQYAQLERELAELRARLDSAARPR